MFQLQNALFLDMTSKETLEDQDILDISKSHSSYPITKSLSIFVFGSEIVFGRYIGQDIENVILVNSTNYLEFTNCFEQAVKLHNEDSNKLGVFEVTDTLNISVTEEHNIRRIEIEDREKG